MPRWILRLTGAVHRAEVVQLRGDRDAALARARETGGALRARLENSSPTSIESVPPASRESDDYDAPPVSVHAAAG